MTGSNNRLRGSACLHDGESSLYDPWTARFSMCNFMFTVMSTEGGGIRRHDMRHVGKRGMNETRVKCRMQRSTSISQVPPRTQCLFIVVSEHMT